MVISVCLGFFLLHRKDRAAANNKHWYNLTPCSWRLCGHGVSRKLKDASHSQIKQHSLSVKCLGPKTAKPEENEPPRDPCCGWQDTTVKHLCLKETQDNEIIFNLCPFQALSTPVILDGPAREGGSQIRFKVGNYYTNYPLQCGGWLPLLVQVNTRLRARQLRPEQLGGTVVPHLFPLQIFDLLSCLQSVLWRGGGGEGGENQPQTFNCSTETGEKSTGSSICSACTVSLAQKLSIEQVAQFPLSCLLDLLGVVAMPSCVTMRYYFS